MLNVFLNSIKTHMPCGGNIFHVLARVSSAYLDTELPVNDCQLHEAGVPALC